MHMNTRLLLLIALTVSLLACTTQPRKWPPITTTATGHTMPGRWVWADLICDDPEQAKRFYSQVFGWHFTDAGTSDNPYYLVFQGQQPVAGIARYKKQTDSERAARWIRLLSVESVSRATQSISQAGGKVLIPEKYLPGRGELALAADPEGALFGLIHSESGDPQEQFPEENTFFWQELWANDAMAMANFYRSFVNYTATEQKTLNDVDEIRLSVGDNLRAGIIQVKHENISSAWLPYIRVTNLKQTLNKVRSAQGDIIVAPSASIRDGKVAIIKDSQGAALGLVEWHENQQGKMSR